MSVVHQFNEGTRELTINVQGNFNFALVGSFREIYASVENPARIVVDLGETDMIDSSGLGILLYLQKHFGSKKENTFLTNCNPTLKKTLTMAQFGKMFSITHKD